MLRQDLREHHYLVAGASGSGAKWWMQRTARLARDIPTEQLAKRLLAVQYFPYHSARYTDSIPRLKSQEFAFGVVRKAIDRDALVVCTRSMRRWVKAVPELADYDRLATLKNPRAVYFTPRNLARYDELIEALRDKWSAHS
jgi:hypothetical protein